jgi:hypothetical protein
MLQTKVHWSITNQVEQVYLQTKVHWSIMNQVEQLVPRLNQNIINQDFKVFLYFLNQTSDKQLFSKWKTK